MQRAEYLEHFDSETNAFVTAVEKKLGNDVPTCPGWKVSDLAEHVWGVINFWPHVVLHNVQDPDQIPPLRPAPSSGDLMSSILRDKDRAIELLRHSDWTAPLWNWSVNKTVSFVPRRLANEISIHRWDAENATGTAEPISAELANDGIEEFFDIFIASGWPSFKKGKPFSGEVIQLDQTDGHGTWAVELNRRSAQVKHGVTAPDLSLRGTGSDLILMLWRRSGTEGIEIEGDEGILDRFLAYEEPPDDDD